MGFVLLSLRSIGSKRSTYHTFGLAYAVRNPPKYFADVQYRYCVGEMACYVTIEITIRRRNEGAAGLDGVDSVGKKVPTQRIKGPGPREWSIINLIILYPLHAHIYIW